MSDSKVHDAAFVEFCTEILKEHYSKITTEVNFIEISDGCAQQFKSINTISAVSKRPYTVCRLYFETSHGKSKSDGLGGVVKSFVSQTVASEKVIIRNASELYDFCTQYLTIQDREDTVVRNRSFILVNPEDLESITETIKSCSYKTNPGTLKIHQISNKVPIQSGIFVGNFICTCIMS